jgi:hypothetical protein
MSKGSEKNSVKEPTSICVYRMVASNFLLIVETLQILYRK